MKERPILFSTPMVRAILADAKTQTRRVVRHPHIADADIWTKAADEQGRWEFGVASGAPGSFGHGAYVRCPYGLPGDRLWVREAHARFHVGEGLGRPVPECVAYRASCDEDGSFDYVNTRGEIMALTVTKWTPGIHMPRWASRITLEVVSVRVERLQAITEEDARAEGVVEGLIPADEYGPVRVGYVLGRDDGRCTLFPTARRAFEIGWDAINGKPSPMLDDEGEPVLDDDGRPRMIAPRSWASNPWVWVVAFQRVAQEARAA